MTNTGKIKNIVFLDIDGVMTSVINGNSYLCDNESAYGLDKQIKKNLEVLWTEVPNLKFVLETAWLNRGSLTDPTPIWPWNKTPMHTPLPALYCFLSTNGRYLGHVSTQRKDAAGKHITKATKILEWLASKSELLDDDYRALVLDDDDTEYNDLTSLDKINPKVHFQKVNYVTGFDSQELQIAIAYFKGHMQNGLQGQSRIANKDC